MKDAKDIKSLLDQLSKNDEQAFRQLFHLYSNRVYSFVLRLTRSRVTAEEMVQEVFLKIWLNRSTVSAIDDFSSYLFIVTKNLALNVLKRRAIEEKAKIVLGRELVRKHHDTEETVIYRDYEQFLKETIDHLPPQQRMVYSMCRQEGLQYDEVAHRLKISPLTVKSHMQQALKTIKTQFTRIIQAALIFVSMMP